nr:PTS mannitol transporter subunit IICB [uncultured Mediterraneibacter sp.]
MKKGRAKLQAFGGFLTAMVIPNMGAFIAWGFITALFIPTGWIPNEHFNELVQPMLNYLLPLLLAYTGGSLVYGQRGGVAGAIGTIGLIVGADIAMFLGAMIMGPLSAWIVKKFDKAIDGKIPTGFEMVVNNFSLGIIAFLLCLCSYSFIGPVIVEANSFVSYLIQQLVKTGFLPILSVINEPAKVLFLNNVIDQGIYYPLGMQQVAEVGKSIYFTVASNPGAGLGLLLAYSVFGKGEAKKTAPGALIIHFFGGIHEMYFPYVLMNPVLIVAMILGNGAGTLVYSILDVGLVAGPSPGSIFAYLMLTPKGNFLGIIAGVLVSAAVSFLVASSILKVSKGKGTDEDLQASTARSKAMKQEGKDILKKEMLSEIPVKEEKEKITNVAFACDAGLGSSAMGAGAFRKKLKEQGIDITVKHYAIERVPAEAQVVVTHENLLERAKIAMPDKRIVTIKNFLGDPNINLLIEEIVEQQEESED